MRELALGTYLKRKKVWQSLKKETAVKVGEFLVPDTFCQRYAKVSHSMNLPIANISSAMGHTIKVHLENYARFTTDETADLYDKANKTVKAA